MKLHLPKALLTMVLAACFAPAVWATSDNTTNSGWGKLTTTDNNNQTVPATNSYAIGDATIQSIDTTDSSSADSTLFIRSNNGVSSATVENFIIGAGDTAKIDGWYNENVDHPEFSNLTIKNLTFNNSSLYVESANKVQVNALSGTAKEITVNGSLSVGTAGVSQIISVSDKISVGAGGTLTVDGGTLKLTTKDDKTLTAANAEIIVNKGAVLQLVDTDTIDYSASNMKITLDGGELALGAKRQTLGHTTLTLKDGKVTSLKADNTACFGDNYGALDINQTDSAIVSSGTSSIQGGVRLRKTGKFNVIDGTLTVDSIFNGNNSGSGIIKEGLGTLKITSMASNTQNEAFYIGSTEMRGGAIEYALTSTGTYTGTIFGRGDIINSGSGTVTLSKVSNLDGNITVSAGVLNITSLAANKTMGVNVAEGAALNIGSISLNQVYGDLQLDAVSATYSDNSAGTSTANGFRTGEVVLRLFDGYEWEGTIAGYDVSVQDGDTLVTTNAGDSSSTYYVNEGTHKISDSSDYVKERAQGYSVAKDANLVIDGSSGSLTAAQLLTGTLGDGNIILGTNITLTSGAATQISGNIIVNSGFDLKLGTNFSTGSAQQGVAVNIAGGIVLNGGQLSFCGDTTTLKSVTTQGAGSKIYIRDMFGSNSKASGTFTIENLTLNADTQYQSSWKSNVEFKNLSGSGKLLLSKRDGGDKQMITIHAGKNYTGQLDLDGGADMSVYLNIAEGAKTRIKGDNDSTITKLSFANNATLALDTEGGTINGVANSAYTYTLKAVEVADTATISVADSGNGWQAQVNIDSLTNEEGSSTGKLNLTSNTNTSQRAIVNLNGGTFNGEIALTGSPNGGDRKIALNINDDDVAKNAVITLNGKGSELALAVGAEHIIVKGINNAENANGTMKIVSGAQEYSSNSSFASDSTTRTLEINTNGGSYSTSAVLGANINLKKSGSGTQAFTGSMANFNGSITVTEGKLALSAAGLSNNTGSFTVTQNTAESILQFDVSEDIEIKDVSLKGGASLLFFNKNQTDGTRVTDIEKLTIDGAGTVGTFRDKNCFQGIININSLSNTGTSAELTLKNASQTDDTTVINLNGGTFTGTINLESDSAKASDYDRWRKLQVNLANTDVAENAVINFQDSTTETATDKKSNYIFLGVGVEGAKVAGLTGTTANAATIKSSEANTTRSLEIITAKDANYSTNAKVESSVNLVKSGEGKQTISGAVSTTGSVKVNDGELALTGTSTLSLNQLSLFDTTNATGGTLSVGSANGGTVNIVSAGSVVVGKDSVLNGNLTLGAGTALTLNGYGDNAATINGTLTLGTGMQVSGLEQLLNDLAAQEAGADGLKSLKLFNVTAVDFGTVEATLAMAADALVEEQPLIAGYDASKYFSTLSVGEYALVFQNSALYIQATAPIPEPTTATLSLLALTALAARRRRK